jgi:hypothetical protein
MKRSGPSLRAAPFLRTDSAAPAELLTPRQRRELAAIATRVRLPPRKLLYREGAPATWIISFHDRHTVRIRDRAALDRLVAAI